MGPGAELYLVGQYHTLGLAFVRYLDNREILHVSSRPYIPLTYALISVWHVVRMCGLLRGRS